VGPSKEFHEKERMVVRGATSIVFLFMRCDIAEFESVRRIFTSFERYPGTCMPKGKAHGVLYDWRHLVWIE
jgi:hypothetical protein